MNNNVYYSENGSYPVVEFIKSLPKKDAAKILREIDLLEAHGFMKKSQRTPKTELKIATERINKFIKSKGGQSYET